MAKQVETATIATGTTLAGNAKAVVTSAYMPNSPKTITVVVGAGITADAAAALFRATLALDGDVTTAFAVSGATDKIILTDHYNRANDTSLNIATDNDTCTGLTTAATSADTIAGSGLTNSYATLAEFKSFSTVRGGSSSTDANDDTVIEDILEMSSRYIDQQTRRRFWYNTVDETRYYTPQDHEILFVDDLSAAPTSLRMDLDGERTYTTTMDSTDYDLEPSNALLNGQPYTWLELAPLAAETFPTIRKGVQIIGKFGFPSVPDEIKSACLGISLNVYQNRSGQSSAGNITVTASGVVIRPQDVPGWAQEIINKYKRLI
jgi:hypothetical protein